MPPGDAAGDGVRAGPGMLQGRGGRLIALTMGDRVSFTLATLGAPGGGPETTPADTGGVTLPSRTCVRGRGTEGPMVCM